MSREISAAKTVVMDHRRDGREQPIHQLGPRLAPANVQRGDDHVEPGKEVVIEVEAAVRPDLELAAVEQPEATGLRALVSVSSPQVVRYATPTGTGRLRRASRTRLREVRR